MRPLPRRMPKLGSAEKVVLLELTQLQSGKWSRNDGTSLYESRGLTEPVCQRLAVRGLVDERFEGSHTEYIVNEAGKETAEQLRSELSSTTVRTGG